MAVAFAGSLAATAPTAAYAGTDSSVQKAAIYCAAGALVTGFFTFMITWEPFTTAKAAVWACGVTGGTAGVAHAMEGKKE